MNRCPITYEDCGNADYSVRGLSLLSRGLETLAPLALSQAQQREESLVRMEKMSIQGVQSKLSAVFERKKNGFTIVDTGGKFILKPQSAIYAELPQNEDFTMKLAAFCGIETPLHGLVYDKNRELTYFIKRFDRGVRKEKFPLEDFAQLSGKTRDTKYDASVEQVVEIVDTFATVPLLEKIQLLRRLIFSYLIGNEDMHLKNYSLLTRGDMIKLAPAYDLLSTTIALKNAREESALPLGGKRNNLTRQLFTQYLAVERMQLLSKTVATVEAEMIALEAYFSPLLEKSFLSPLMQEKYSRLFKERLTKWKSK